MSSIDDLLTFKYSDEESYESDTAFKLDDVPSGKRLNGESYKKFYKRLSYTNSGTHTGTLRNEDVIRKCDNIRLLEAVISSIELTPYQKSESKRIFEGIKLNTFGYSTEMVAFCVAAVVCKRDGRQWDEDELFLSHLEDSRFDSERLEICLNALEDEL